jgi:hypothetical protein
VVKKVFQVIECSDLLSSSQLVYSWATYRLKLVALDVFTALYLQNSIINESLEKKRTSTGVLQCCSEKIRLSSAFRYSAGGKQTYYE